MEGWRVEDGGVEGWMVEWWNGGRVERVMGRGVGRVDVGWMDVGVEGWRDGEGLLELGFARQGRRQRVYVYFLGRNMLPQVQS